MPGTIHVSVLEFKGFSSSVSETYSTSLKLSMGKRSSQTRDNGEFYFPIIKLSDDLVVTLVDGDGNEIANTGIRTMQIIQKGTWDEIFPFERGGHVHLRLRFALNEDERNRIRAVRESAIKKNLEAPASSRSVSESTSSAPESEKMFTPNNLNVTDSRAMFQAEAGNSELEASTDDSSMNSDASSVGSTSSNQKEGESTIGDKMLPSSTFTSENVPPLTRLQKSVSEKRSETSSVYEKVISVPTAAKDDIIQKSEDSIKREIEMSSHQVHERKSVKKNEISDTSVATTAGEKFVLKSEDQGSVKKTPSSVKKMISAFEKGQIQDVKPSKRVAVAQPQPGTMGKQTLMQNQDDEMASRSIGENLRMVEDKHLTENVSDPAEKDVLLENQDKKEAALLTDKSSPKDEGILLEKAAPIQPHLDLVKTDDSMLDETENDVRNATKGEDALLKLEAAYLAEKEVPLDNQDEMTALSSDEELTKNERTHLEQTAIVQPQIDFVRKDDSVDDNSENVARDTSSEKLEDTLLKREVPDLSEMEVHLDNLDKRAASLSTDEFFTKNENVLPEQAAVTLPLLDLVMEAENNAAKLTDERLETYDETFITENLHPYIISVERQEGSISSGNSASLAPIESESSVTLAPEELTRGEENKSFDALQRQSASEVTSSSGSMHKDQSPEDSSLYSHTEREERRKVADIESSDTINIPETSDKKSESVYYFSEEYYSSENDGVWIFPHNTRRLCITTAGYQVAHILELQNFESDIQLGKEKFSEEILDEKQQSKQRTEISNHPKRGSGSTLDESSNGKLVGQVMKVAVVLGFGILVFFACKRKAGMILKEENDIRSNKRKAAIGQFD